MDSRQPKLNIEEAQIFLDGRRGFLLTNKVPLFDRSQQLIGILGVYTDITDIKNAKHAAESANRAKTEFLANMSHDVKTPLTGIVGMADLIMHDANVSEQERGRANMIHACGMQVVTFLTAVWNYRN